MNAAQVASNKFHRGNAVDGKHYWLTPPELLEQIEAEFGRDLFDPCPYPKPDHFNGLTCAWHKVNYVNPPFGAVIIEGKKTGMTAWVQKAIAEQARGKTSILVWPMDGWFHMLLAAGAEMCSLGDVKWLATEDGTPQKGGSREIVRFVLRGAARCGAEAPPQNGEAALTPPRSDSPEASGDAGLKSIEIDQEGL